MATRVFALPQVHWIRAGGRVPCISVHNDKKVATRVHGDDFTSVGAKCDVDWLEKLMEAKYDLRKGGMLGPGKEDAKEILVFNRVIRYTDNGL